MTLVSAIKRLMPSACIRNATFLTVRGTIGEYISQNQERGDRFLVVLTKRSRTFRKLCHNNFWHFLQREGEKNDRWWGKKNGFLLSTQKGTPVTLSELSEWNLQARFLSVGAGTGAGETLFVIMIDVLLVGWGKKWRRS